MDNITRYTKVRVYDKRCSSVKEITDVVAMIFDGADMKCVTKDGQISGARDYDAIQIIPVKDEDIILEHYKKLAEHYEEVYKNGSKQLQTVSDQGSEDR